MYIVVTYSIFYNYGNLRIFLKFNIKLKNFHTLEKAKFHVSENI